MNTGSELTFTLSAHKGYNVKTLTIGGTAYSVVSNKRITTKVTITKETSISAILEAETKPAPKPDNPPPENPEQGNSNPPNPNPTPQPDTNPNPTPNPNPSNPTPNTKYKVTVTQPANGTIEVVPALPSDGMVDKGSELTFRLSANAGYKVKALTIGDATYSDVTDNTITQKVKIEKETAVSATVEEEATPTPETGIFTDTQGNKVTIAPVDIYGGEIIGYRLTGDIYIEDINSAAFKAKLDTLNGKDLYTDSLNINCFANQNSTITPVTITPELLNDILKVGQKFSNFELNNKLGNKIVEVELSSATNNYFDITKFSKFDFNAEFKLKNGSKIYLNGKKSPDPLPAGWDLTEYSTTNEMVKIASNDSLREKLIVDNVKLRGNIKDLLPYLVKRDKKIREINGGIIFNNRWNADCTGISKTGYYGNESGDILNAEQIQELHKRVNNEGLTIYNVIFENLNCQGMSEEELKNTSFTQDIICNLEFKGENTDLTNISFKNTSHIGRAIFTGKLPIDMGGGFSNVLIHDAEIPDLRQDKPNPAGHNGWVKQKLPIFTNKLVVKNLRGYEKIWQGWSKEELEEFNLWFRKPPEQYIGPKEIYDVFKVLCLKPTSTYYEPIKSIYFNNEGAETGIEYTEDKNGNIIKKNKVSFIQKQQNQLLALLQTQNKSRG